MEKQWVLSIRDQCRQAKVPFFFKQWGGWNKKAAGRIFDGCTFDEMPPRLQYPVPHRKDRLAMIEEVQGIVGKGA